MKKRLILNQTQLQVSHSKRGRLGFGNTYGIIQIQDNLKHKSSVFQKNAKSYLALREASRTLALNRFRSSVATGGGCFEWAAPNELSSTLLPNEIPSSLLSSPDRVYFWSPILIKSNVKHSHSGGKSPIDVALPRELVMEPKTWLSPSSQKLPDLSKLAPE